MNYKVIVLIILAATFLYKLFLEYLDVRSVKNPLPENVSDIYDAEKYRTWRNYKGEKSRNEIISLITGFVVEFIVMAFNVYACFSGLFPNVFFWGMFAVLLLNNLLDIFQLPIAYYDDMKIEAKYGFNRKTKKTFWADRIKSFLISLIILTIVGAILIFFHTKLGDWLIVAFTGVLMLIILLISFLYPIFSKIFNKFTPLEDGELKEKLTALLEKNGYKVRAIQVMDGSKRSTKMNAYFTGFGKMKTVVLYDTLKEAMTVDEICAVFAHEMGHGLHKDTLKSSFMSFIEVAILSFLAWFTLKTPEIFTAFGFDKINYGFAIILIMSVEFALIQPLFSLVSNYFSRIHEYRADEQAVKEGYGKALIVALKKLAENNFADLSPNPIIVKLYYSHPTLSQRFEAIEKSLNK
ncbi:MAG: M48 family metallopeptidase [Lachnospiraceae bacterium]|nr:M48 family metallopeptidase [Lachnospiraceae bacterium]